MAIYSARLREEEFIKQEYSGDDTNSGEISDSMIISLNVLWKDYSNTEILEDIKNIAAYEGVDLSYNIPFSKSALKQIENPTAYLFDYIETWIIADEDYKKRNRFNPLNSFQYEEYSLEYEINLILQRERFNQKLINGQFIPYNKLISYQGLNYLWTTDLPEKYSKVKEKLLEAISEYADSKYEDCNTDVGVALEIFFTIHDFPMNNLGNKIAAFKAKGLMDQNDHFIFDWLRTLRNKQSDAHDGNGSKQYTSWMYLEIAAATIEKYSKIL